MIINATNNALRRETTLIDPLLRDTWVGIGRLPLQKNLERLWRGFGGALERHKPCTCE